LFVLTFFCISFIFFIFDPHFVEFVAISGQHLSKCHGIVELILKDNEFGDEGVGNICATLATAEEAAFESLILDGNFKWKNQRERFTTVKKIATLLSSPNCMVLNYFIFFVFCSYLNFLETSVQR
jgi:hypothetical protein